MMDHYKLIKNHEWAWDQANDIWDMWDKLVKDCKEGFEPDEIHMIRFIAEALVEAKGETR